MLKSTEKFLIESHIAFDELGYHPLDHHISFKKLQNATIKTLNHTKELEDSIDVVNMFKFLSTNMDKLCSKIERHSDFWKSLPYEGNELLSLVSDEETFGTYFITNAFDSKYDKVFICGHDLDDDCLVGVSHSGGKFFIDDKDFEYYLRFSKISSTKMVLLDKRDNKLCVLVLSEDNNVFLENNKTDYEIILYEGGMGIYKKDYIDSLRGKEPEFENINAFIEWDILETDSEFGLSRLECFDDDCDVELFIYLAMSCFLLFRSYINDYKRATAAQTIMYCSWMRRLR